MRWRRRTRSASRRPPPGPRDPPASGARPPLLIPGTAGRARLQPPVRSSSRVGQCQGRFDSRPPAPAERGGDSGVALPVKEQPRDRPGRSQWDLGLHQGEPQSATPAHQCGGALPPQRRVAADRRVAIGKLRSRPLPTRAGASRATTRIDHRPVPVFGPAPPWLPCRCPGRRVRIGAAPGPPDGSRGSGCCPR